MTIPPNYDRTNHKYHYFYKITNLINDKFYYGIHSTDNLNDNYFGSGKLLWKAINKYGKENFKKEILEYFDNVYDLLKREQEIVNEELIKNPNCYNVILGGGFSSTGLSVYKDNNGNSCLTYKDDIRVLSGELTAWSKGLTVVKDKYGKTYSVSVDDERLKTGELVGIQKGKTTPKDKYGKTYSVSVDDERLKTGELVGIQKGYKPSDEVIKQTIENLTGRIRITDSINNLMIKREDLDNYIKRGWKLGCSDDFKQKMSAASIGYRFVNNGDINKNVPKEKYDWYLNNGWTKGRLPLITLNNGEKNIKTNKNKINQYLNDGWVIGRLKMTVVNNGKNNKSIPEIKLQEYLNNGWKHGKAKRN